MMIGDGVVALFSQRFINNTRSSVIIVQLFYCRIICICLKTESLWKCNALRLTGNMRISDDCILRLWTHAPEHSIFVNDNCIELNLLQQFKITFLIVQTSTLTNRFHRWQRVTSVEDILPCNKFQRRSTVWRGQCVYVYLTDARSKHSRKVFNEKDHRRWQLCLPSSFNRHVWKIRLPFAHRTCDRVWNDR